MKFLLIILVSLISITASSQSIFYPIPPPKSALAMGVAQPTTQTDFRFLTSVSATISDGTQLNGGLGIAMERNSWDATSNAYITKYFIAALGFIGTDGTKITGTAGAVLGIPGTNGIFGVGPGYDFTNKKPVLITGVFIKL